MLQVTDSQANIQPGRGIPQVPEPRPMASWCLSMSPFMTHQIWTPGLQKSYWNMFLQWSAAIHTEACDFSDCYFLLISILQNRGVIWLTCTLWRSLQLNRKKNTLQRSWIILSPFSIIRFEIHPDAYGNIIFFPDLFFKTFTEVVWLLCFSEYLIRLVSEFTNWKKLDCFSFSRIPWQIFSEIFLDAGLC